MKIESLFNLEETIAKDLLQSEEYPWEILPKINDYILKIGPTLDKNIFNQVDDEVWIAKSAKVAPTASITGPTIIDENAEIRHCAFIRGKAIIGKNTVVGNSSELKNSILFNNVKVPHYNYIGDSILGYKAHMGAGSINSNIKSDKGNIQIKINATEQIETNLRKVGAFIGDEVEVGCNSVLNPGTIVGRKSIIYPLSCVRGVIPENSIYKNKNEIVEKKQ